MQITVGAKRDKHVTVGQCWIALDDDASRLLRSFKRMPALDQDGGGVT